MVSVGIGLRKVKGDIYDHQDCIDAIYQAREARREILDDYFCWNLRRAPQL